MRALVFTAVTATACFTFFEAVQGREDSNLKSWLAGLRVDVPPVKISVGPLGPLLVEDVFCEGFEIDDVEVSTFDSSVDNANSGFQLTLSGLAIRECNGNYTAANLGAAGAVQFSLAHTLLSVGAVFNASSISKPLSFPSKICSCSVSLPNLRFQGTGSHLLNAASPLLIAEIQALADHHACRILSTSLEPLLSLLSPFLIPPEPVTHVPIPTQAQGHRLVRWAEDVPLFPTAEKYSKELPSLWDPIAENLTAGHFSVDLSEQSGSLIALPFNASGGLLAGNAYLQLLEVGLGGLATLNSSSIYAVANDQPFSAGVSTSFKNLNLFVAVIIRVELANSSIMSSLSDSPLRLALNASLNLTKLSANAEALIAGDYAKLNLMTIDGLAELSESEEVFGTIASAFYGVNVSKLNICSQNISVLLENREKKEEIETRIARAVSVALNAFLNIHRFERIPANFLGSFQTRSYATDVVNSFIENISHYGDPSEGAVTEPRPDLKDINPATIRTTSIWVASTALFVMIAFSSLLKFCKRRWKRNATIKSRSNIQEAESPLEMSLLEMGEISHELSENVDGSVITTMSLAQAYQSRPLVFYGLPALHIISMMIGLWSLLVPVCDVRVRARGGVVDPGKIVLDDSLLVYSFGQMVKDFWDSGSWMISVLLVAGTAIMPQTKGVMTLILWVTPTSRKVRSVVLCLIDIMGRFVLVCQCFILLVVITLRASLEVPGFHIDVVAEPIYSIAGATFGLLAMIFTSILTQLAHDLLPYEDGPLQKVAAENVVGQKVVVRIPRYAQIFALSTCFAAAAAMVCAWSNELIEFKIDGLGGVVENSEQSQMPAAKPIYNIGLMRQAERDTDEKWIARFAGISIVVLTVAIPTMCCLCWTIEWLWISMTGTVPSRHPNIFLRASAWLPIYLYGSCALDVLWASLGSAVLEMDLVTQWIVQKQPGIGKLCTSLDSYGIQCIKVKGSLREGSWFLLAAAILCAICFIVKVRYLGIRPLHTKM